jgi:hypothetical protein
VRLSRQGAHENRGGEYVSTTPESDRNQRPCVFKHCDGTMTHTDSAQLPGTGAIARMSDGALKTVGTMRRGWICDQNPNHVQTEGISSSEVVRSQM